MDRAARAVSVVTAAADGREPETALTGAILTAAEVDETIDLIGWAADATPAQFATLAPVVVAVAESGDLRANAVLTLAVEELVLHVRALARQLFGDERAALPVALTGGMLGRGSTLRKRLEHRLKSAVPGRAAPDGAGDPGARRGARGAAHRRRGGRLDRRVGHATFANLRARQATRRSRIFAVHDERGALLRVLEVFDRNGINLSRIESRPSRQRAWDYIFVADLEATSVG